MVFKNEFSWSKSRDGLFRECKRKYYFNYYGYWNGWVASEEERVKRIYYLKKLRNKSIWLGSLVHEVIEFILNKLKMGEEIGLGRANAFLMKRMENDFEVSKVGGYSGFVSKMHRFFEDEYRDGISDKEKEILIEKGKRCLKNFYNSDIFMDIRLSRVEDWITLEDFLFFDFEGTRVYLSIDFAMRVGDKIILFDWKTGEERQSDYGLQLGLYAFFIFEKFGVSPENIIAKMFYLGLGNEGKVDSFEVSSDWLDEIQRVLRSSILEMKKVLRVPEENKAVEKDFEKSEGFWCRNCSFQKICSEK